MLSGNTPRVAHGPAGTERAGVELARILAPGDVVLFRGEVGAGKSTMVRAILRELGVRGAIPSPTFTIGRTYETARRHPTNPGVPLTASHLDLHRLGRIEGEDPGLLSEYFGEDRIALVEWPEGKEEFLARNARRLVEVGIGHRDEGSRYVELPDPASVRAGDPARPSTCRPAEAARAVGAPRPGPSGRPGC